MMNKDKEYIQELQDYLKRLEKPKTKIIHNKIKCKKCGQILESKNRHDFKWCKCKSCAVDGGHDYLKRCGNFNDWEELSEFKELDIDEKIHYIKNYLNFSYLNNTQLNKIINIIEGDY